MLIKIQCGEQGPHPHNVTAAVTLLKTPGCAHPLKPNPAGTLCVEPRLCAQPSH